MKRLEIGTLISDNNKIGVVTKVLEMGTLDACLDIIKWRANYEIHYVDGVVSILGCVTVDRLVKEDRIQIIYVPTTPLPPSSSSEDILRKTRHLCDQEHEKSKESRRKECVQQKPRKNQ